VTLRLAALVALLLAGGCATVPPAGSPDDWPARRTRLQALEVWTLEGRVAVAAGDDGFSGGFDWAQRGHDADIVISGPMGGHVIAMRVAGDKGAVSISGDDEAGGAEDAERVLARYFSTERPLPVEAMRYWLVGAPAPTAPHDETLGADQRLASLEQSGWQVRYDRYESVGALALPARMEMTTEGLRLRVVVSDWRIPP
jgi:outer membrane lipoprotein LolB